MGAGRSGLWAPVLVGNVVYLVHFVLVILRQKKNRTKNPTAKLDKSRRRNRTINRTKYGFKKGTFNQAKHQTLNRTKKWDKQKKFGPRVGRKIQQ